MTVMIDCETQRSIISSVMDGRPGENLQELRRRSGTHRVKDNVARRLVPGILRQSPLNPLPAIRIFLNGG